MDWRLEDRIALLAGQASARDVCHNLPWLRPPLVATESARERLKAWALAGGLARPKPDTTGLRFIGDRAINVSAIQALDTLAPPARDFILDNVIVFGAGVTIDGCCGTLPPWPALKVVALRRGVAPDVHDPGEAFYARRIALHEFAHAWLEPVVTWGPSATSEQMAATDTPSPGKHYTKEDRPIEIRAWALTENWEGEPLGPAFWLTIRRTMS